MPNTSSSLLTTIDNRCALCKKPSTKRCVNCWKHIGKQVFYCNKDCQRKHWPEHKRVCSVSSPPPSPAKKPKSDDDSHAGTTLGNAASCNDNNNNPIGAADRCVLCRKQAVKFCAKCDGVGQKVFYCSARCQRKDLHLHKHFCALPFPEKKLKESVFGFLLCEDATKPEIVEVALNCQGVAASHLILGIQSDQLLDAKYMYRNFYKNDKGNFPRDWFDTRLLLDNNQLVFQFKQDVRHSKLNKCIQAITNRQSGQEWAGPMLVTKADTSKNPPQYQDVTLADGSDVIDHLRFHNSDYNHRMAWLIESGRLYDDDSGSGDDEDYSYYYS